MAADYRSTDSSIADKLSHDPSRFDFFQAVRLLDKPSGTLRFTATASLAFPASEILGINTAPDENSMHVSFLSLTGAHGPLPFWISELIQERLRLGDTTLRDFLDIFNNRLIRLFYHGIESATPGHLLSEHPSRSSFSEYFYSLAGLASRIRKTANSSSRLSLSSLLRHTGLYNTNPKSASGLRRIISDLFNVDSEVVSFRGAWLRLEKTDHTHIGRRNNRNNILGENAVLGTRFFDQAAGFTLRLKNLTYTEYLSFLPHPPGTLRDLLLELVRFYTRSGLECYLELELRPEERPPIHIGTDGNGWLGWI